jgi:hypothetical protein
MTLERRCELCGHEFFAFGDDTKLVVKKSSLANGQIFRLREAPAWVFCTAHAKKVFEDSNFTNITFQKHGIVV